jgi:AcrR family transcriptional regulator
MARRKGDKNADYEVTRLALTDALMSFVVTQEGADAGLRGLAEAAGVSMATLRHYFEDRSGVYRAVLKRFGEMGAGYLAQSSTPQGPFPQSMNQLCAFVLEGFSVSFLLGMHSAALREGPKNQAVAIAYLEHVFDPTVAAVELRLKAHMSLGDMRQADARVAALGVISPIYLAALHQGPLCGTQTRPLDLNAFVESHAEAFIVAYAGKAAIISS